MNKTESDKLCRRIKVLLYIFVFFLLLSGLTAFPLNWELERLNHWVGEGTAVEKTFPQLSQWIMKVYIGLKETDRKYPFIAYGTDWLAFAHIVIAIAFIGPICDPVRNVWVVEFGIIAALPVIFGLPALASPVTTVGAGGPATHYSGCLMFFDDFDNRDSERLLLDYFAPQRLLRSWYRFGEPSADKDYRLRRPAVEAMEKQGILLGGGGSLSIVNELDLGSSDFNRDWLSVNLDGTVYRKNDRWYGTLSHPGFRAYLIGKALEQVKVGVKELHLGETNGKIRFDDYSLGLAGDCGFVQWIRKKYETRDAAWWAGYLGNLGTLISNGGNISRADFIAADTNHRENFRQEWGRPDSWHGKNDNDQPAFLAYLYSRNLDCFISELREKLAEGGFDDVSIDIWGLADWIVHLRSKPDAVIESIPDRRWDFDWSRQDFPTDGEKERIKKIMAEMMEQAEPAQMIFAIDHPQPFGMFRKLPDSRQADLIRWFYEISRNMGANFLFRSYSLEQEDLGPMTKDALRELCRQARR